MEEINFYTKGEEIANAITHGIGTILSILGLVLLIVFANRYGNAWYVVSYIIYGSCMVLLYLESTLYHSITNRKVKKLFRIFDHSSIYLLIAGTYTPFLLTALRGKTGWIMFGVIWGLSVIGIIMKVFWLGKLNKIETMVYIAMGWIIIFQIKKLMQIIPGTGIVLLVIGGVLYTVGALLYMKDDIPYNHAIWHVFVLAGSICHFLCILLYLLPIR